MSGRKPYRHQFPLSVIGYALRLYHRFSLSQRDVQELLHERGVVVSHETLRQWNIKFAPLLTEELRHREPRRGSRWHLDEMHVSVGGVTTGCGGRLTSMETSSTFSFRSIAIPRPPDPSSCACWRHTTSRWSPPPAATTSYNSHIDRLGNRKVASSPSNDGDERRNSSICTPDSRTCTVIPALPLPPPSDEATRPSVPDSFWGRRVGRHQHINKLPEPLNR